MTGPTALKIAIGSLAVIAGALAIVLMLMVQWRAEDQARDAQWRKEDQAQTKRALDQAANKAAYERCVFQSGPQVCSLVFAGSR
jgi:hypothetical protein